MSDPKSNMVLLTRQAWEELQETLEGLRLRVAQLEASLADEVRLTGELRKIAKSEAKKAADAEEAADAQRKRAMELEEDVDALSAGYTAGYAECEVNAVEFFRKWIEQKNPARNADYDEALNDVLESIQKGEHRGAAARKGCVK